MNFKTYVVCFTARWKQLLCSIRFSFRGMKAASVFHCSLLSNIDSVLAVNVKLPSVRQVVILDKRPPVRMYQYAGRFIYKTC